MDIKLLKQHEDLKAQIDRDICTLDGLRNRNEALKGIVNKPGITDTLHSLNTQIVELQRIIELAQQRFIEEQSEIEDYLSGIDNGYICLLLSMRYIDMMTWRDVAVIVGGGNTKDSIRMVCYRYLKNACPNENPEKELL